MFLPTLTKNIPASGQMGSKIAILLDKPSGWDMKAMRLFSSTDGNLFEQILHSIGLIRSELYITSLFKSVPKTADYNNGTFSEYGLGCVIDIKEELAAANPNIIVCMGEAALAALTKIINLNKYRGYLFAADLNGKITKVLPTIHPRDALHINYHFRYLIQADMQKAKKESTNASLERPPRTIVTEYTDIAEVLNILKEFETVKQLAFDIEVLNYEVSCISFAKHPYESYAIPIANTWTVQEECLLWRAIDRVLSNPNSAKICQNGVFDIQFLLAKNGIQVQGSIYDTMIAHHIMYPDLPKNLGFLGSLYCGTQEYWKDTVRFNNIKDES